MPQVRRRFPGRLDRRISHPAVVSSVLLLVAACSSDAAGTDDAATTTIAVGPAPATSAAAVVVTVAVAVAPVTTPPAVDFRGILEGTEWELDAWFDATDGEAVPRGVRDSTITFEGGVATIDTSCNSGSVGYAVAGDQITFDAMAITEFACDPLSGSVEAAIVDTLQGTTTMSFASGVLYLDQGDRRLVYLDDRRE